MSILMFCPDANGDCPTTNPSKCSTTCDQACDCPSTSQYKFYTEPPNYDLSAADKATLEANCGGPNSYEREPPVDNNGTPIGIADCYKPGDPTKRLVCYKCKSYTSTLSSPAFSGPGYASVGPGGSSVFIG